MQFKFKILLPTVIFLIFTPISYANPLKAKQQCSELSFEYALELGLRSPLEDFVSNHSLEMQFVDKMRSFAGKKDYFGNKTGSAYSDSSNSPGATLKRHAYVHEKFSYAEHLAIEAYTSGSNREVNPALEISLLTPEIVMYTKVFMSALNKLSHFQGRLFESLSCQLQR